MEFSLPVWNAAPVSDAEIVLVHSSDLHVDADPHQGPYGDDGTTGLRVVLDAAKAHGAHYVLLVGDIFDNNRQPPAIIDQCVSLLSGCGRPVIVLPGNHDPITDDSVWLRGGLNAAAKCPYHRRDPRPGDSLPRP